MRHSFLTPFAVAALLLTGLAGCSSTGDSVISPSPSSAANQGEIVFYESEDAVPGEYEVVEVITPPDHIAREGSGYEGTGAIRRYVRRRAAALGANAVLLVSTAEADSDSRALATVRNGYTLAQTRFVAIKVAPSARPAQ